MAAENAVRVPAALLEASPFGAAASSASPLIFLPGVNDPLGGLGQPTSAVLADVNGDGKLDLVASFVPDLLVILLGNGDGTFKTGKIYGSGLSDPSGLAVVDVNGDAKPDLIVAKSCGATCDLGTVAVLLGNGDGTFNAAVDYSSAGYEASSVGAADVNGDGKLDLVVANSCRTSSCSGNGIVAVLLGNGDGTFQSALTYDSGGPSTISVAIADLNGDGYADVVVGNSCQSATLCIANDEVAVLVGNGDGTFQTPVIYGSAGYFTRVTVSDVNDDGYPDLLTANGCSSFPCTGADTVIGVLLNNGNGTLQAAVPYDSGFYNKQVVAADVTGDGKRDLVVGNDCVDNSCTYAIAVLQGNGDGTFHRAVTYVAGGRVELAVGDLNADGKPDVVAVGYCDITSTSCTSGDSAAVLLNNNGAPATTTSLLSSANPITIYQGVTYTATVARGSGGTLSGTVMFADGSVPIATVALSSNTAIYHTSYKSFGTHAITASYSGIYQKAEGSRSATLIENVLFPSKTALTTSGSPTFVGQPVTFTARVTSTYGAIPNGEVVNFYDESIPLGSALLSGGSATFTTSTLTAKTHGIRAIYVGDSKFVPNKGFVTQVVNRYSTTTTLTCRPNPSNFKQVVTMSARVESAGPNIATGNVTFRDGTTWIGAGTLSAGVATMRKSNLAVGAHSITATYNGDSMSAKSTSDVVNEMVN